MDIEKLIRRLRNDADAYRNGETLGRAFADQEDVLDNAATALSTLQAENEKLRAEVESLKKGYCAGCSIPAVKAEQIRDLTDAPKLRAELEQVKRERDAAKSTLAERIGVRGAEPITTAFGLPLDRLRELAKADREGRCVVLPCKPSDVTVYQLRNKKHARGIGVSPRHISCATVWAGGHYALHHQGQDDCLGRDFKKTWFLDKAEAQAALRKERE